ncbi:MAG: fibrobacter succinogenes major paralogous domain-containing protein [Bacteroidales bacterium]|jgi:uncharacterized protein (TIGR02145 family)|nr:fibrobacter succinogenes major paralogous domain-containing protein [Bacteroidales bacterium]
MKKTLLIIIVLFLGVFLLRGQTVHLATGKVYIAPAGYFYIPGGNTLHIENNIVTTRSSDLSLRGMLSFAESADWNSSNQSFVNGFVRSHSPDAFIFPVGQNEYRPAAISGASDAAPTDVAYYHTAQFTPTALSSELSAITDESWIIQGTVAATITLSWNSDLTTLVGVFDDLCITGWDPILNKWVEVASEVDLTSQIFGTASQLNTRGSVSTTSAIVPNSYAAYSIGVKGCQKQIPDEILKNDTLPAYRFMPVDLSLAVDMLPGILYTYYTDSDGTGKITGNVVIFNPPKDDYYVKASIGNCESSINQIILKDPCPEYIKDTEDNKYKVTSLGGMCWTENLRSTVYFDSGEPISFALPYTCLGCPDQLDTIFGLLYDWYSAVNDGVLYITHIQGICPAGWHIPSQSEWGLLQSYSAQQLMSTKYWLTPPAPGTDDFGFTAHPAGFYNSVMNRFEDLYGFTGWWASDAELNTSPVPYYYIAYFCGSILKDLKKKEDGLSVRCVND